MARIPLMLDQDVEMGLPNYEDVENFSERKSSMNSSGFITNFRTPNLLNNNNSTNSERTFPLGGLFTKNLDNNKEDGNINAVAFANLAIRLGNIF